MELMEALDNLRKKAARDPGLLDQLLATWESDDAVFDFCSLAAENGCPISVMDLVSAGEEAYAAMRRSTNGGGENSPLLDGEDDYYELFLSDLRKLKN